MAHNEEESKISFATFLFVVGISFWLGMSIAEYHAQKHLEEIELPKCSVNDINVAPDKLPSGEPIHDIKKLEVFTNASN